MLKLNMADLKRPDGGRNRVAPGAFRLTGTKEKRGGHVLEISMPLEKVSTMLGLPQDPAEHKLDLLVLPAEQAEGYGLTGAHFVVIRGDRRPRRKSGTTITMRIGTYRWTDEQHTELDRDWLVEVTPQVIEVGEDAKGLLFRMPPYTEEDTGEDTDDNEAEQAS